MTDDPRIAALAEALHGVICSTLDDFGSHRPGDPAFMCDPVDILAALDAAGWMLVEKPKEIPLSTAQLDWMDQHGRK